MAETQDTELLSVPQVARRLNVSKPTVYGRISDGWIPALRIGDGCGPIRVPERELSRVLRESLERAAGPSSSSATAVEPASAPGQNEAP